MRSRKTRGASLIETLIGAALLILVIGAASVMASASTGVQQSTNDATTAAMRADRAIAMLADAIRKGSFATIQHLDGTTFDDATNDSGFRIQNVRTYTTVPVLDPVSSYHFDIIGGATEGSLIHTQNGIDRVIVNGVTAFSVTRAGFLFTIDIRTRSGPTDDRARTVHATIQAASRNP